jgi:hypothetical protein
VAVECIVANLDLHIDINVERAAMDSYLGLRTQHENEQVLLAGLVL